MNKNAVILAGGISSRMKKSASESSGLTAEQINESDKTSKSMIKVGKSGRPFLDYLIYNIYKAGIKNLLIVIGENDDSLKKHYSEQKLFPELKINFAVQKIPADRVKPFGTADALYQGLCSVEEWQDESFIVMNSDNLYSYQAIKTLVDSPHPNGMIDYDSEGFKFSNSRVKAYAVTKKNKEGFLIDIIEKPTDEEVNATLDNEGKSRVSMNIFKLNYKMIFKYIEDCPVNPERNEKELPTAIKNMLQTYPETLFCYPASEHVPDLTSKDDIIPTAEYLEKHFSDINF